jgi:hypothetical protein
MKLGQKIWLLSPTIGVIAFALLFYYATLLYPGGSYFDRSLTSFSWLQNYWCDLLDNPTITHKDNPAKVIASAAMLVIAISVSLFWIISIQLHANLKQHRLIQLSGSLGIFSMLLLLIDGYHNIGLSFAGVFSLLAFSLTLINAYQQRFMRLFFLACVAIFLSVLSYSLFFSRYYTFALPVIQKLNFLAIGVWMIATNMAVYKQKMVLT